MDLHVYGNKMIVDSIETKALCASSNLADMLINHCEMMNPIDLEVNRQSNNVHTCTDKLVNTIETKLLCAS